MAKKRFDYFDYFKEVSDIICEAAEHLYATLHGFDVNRLQAEIDAMHEIEHKADIMRHEMVRVLSREFITPIEREDIVSLAQTMDTVVDNIEDVLLRIYMYNVEEIREVAVSFAEVIVKCAKELNTVLSEFKSFKNSKNIRDCIIAVNHYESEGDKLLVEGIRVLFTDSKNGEKDLFIWTNIYEYLEVCLDSCEDVTDIIESVIMKNT